MNQWFAPQNFSNNNRENLQILAKKKKRGKKEYPSNLINCMLFDLG